MFDQEKQKYANCIASLPDCGVDYSSCLSFPSRAICKRLKHFNDQSPVGFLSAHNKGTCFQFHLNGVNMWRPLPPSLPPARPPSFPCFYPIPNGKKISTCNRCCLTLIFFIFVLLLVISDHKISDLCIYIYTREHTNTKAHAFTEKGITQ